MRFMLPAATALLLAAPTADDAVTIKAAHYADLVKTIHENQGHVIVVDFWGEY